VSMAHDVKSSPGQTQRQASLVRPQGGPSHRFLSSSPITSPRRAQVISDPLGPRMGSTGALPKSNAQKSYSGRRSSANIAVSPPGPGPARQVRAGEELLSARGRSAIVPPNQSFSQTVPDLNSLRTQEPQQSMLATAPPFGSGTQNSIIRATSSVFRGASNGYTTTRLPESNSSPVILGCSLVAAAAPGNPELVSGIAKSTAGMQPDLSPHPVLRGNSVTTASARLQRSQSPVRGSSVVVETASRGPSLVTTAARTASVEAPRPVRNSSYVAEPGMSGITPPQEVRRGKGASVFSARQGASAIDPGTTFLVPAPGQPGQWSQPLFR
jgi:hypothetical protein